MTLTTKQIPQLVGGVSQQPPLVRLPGQFEECINARQKYALGHLRRNPLEFRGYLAGAPTGNIATHTINRDSSERYKVFLADGVIKVFDLTTLEEKTVATPDGVGYLDTADAKADLKVISIGDYTFILNKSIIPAMKTDLTSDVIDGSKQTFEDLPEAPANGALYEIAGDPSSKFDNYYVIRLGGVWTETVRPGIKYRIDGATMPHLLVRLGDGSFTFEAAEWGDRVVGDTLSNGDPSFIGKRVNDLIFFRGRLGFLSGANIILSALADTFMFFRSTVTASIDSDPIDVATTDTSVNELIYGSVFQKALVVSSDKRQFQLTTNGLLANNTISIDPATSISVSPTCRPLALDSELYLLSSSDQTSYATLQEMYIEQESVSTATADVTVHVPEYLPEDISKMVAEPSQDIILAMAPSTPNTLFVHEFMWMGDKKEQMAWQKWQFPSWTTVVDIETLDGSIEVTLYDSVNGTTQHRVSLEVAVQPVNADVQLYLDFRTQRLTGSYNSGTDRTQFQLPYDVTEHTADIRVVLPNGRLISPNLYTFPASDQVSVPGNVPYAFTGYNYSSTFRLSQFFLQMRDGNLAFAGRMVVRNFVIYYDETAYFKVTVAAHGRDPVVTEVSPATTALFTGKTLGSSYFVLGDPAFQTGDTMFLVAANSKDVTIDITNDSHLSSNFLSIEWTGEFFTRARLQ